MEIDLVFKIAAIGIIVAVLNQLLIRSGEHQRRPDGEQQPEQRGIFLQHHLRRCRKQDHRRRPKHRAHRANRALMVTNRVLICLTRMDSTTISPASVVIMA